MRQLIGVTGQFASVDENLTARENLWMFGRLQGLSSKQAQASATTCSRSSTSTEAARPTHLAVLPGSTPATAARCGTRSATWSLRDPRSLLTTQYLDEADALAGRIAVIDRGRKVAEGTPTSSRPKIGTSSLRVADWSRAPIPGRRRSHWLPT